MASIIVFLDTTNLFTSDLNLNINTPVMDFCKFRNVNFKDNLQIVIPKTVFDERKFQNIRFFEENKSKIVTCSNKIKNHLGLDINLKDLQELKAEEIISKRIQELLSENNILLFECEMDSKIILERFFLKKKPFCIEEDKKIERGLKDTAIWLSFLKFAKENQDKEIIFVTNNSSDFNEETNKEFKEMFKKELIIKPDLPSVEKYLSEKSKLKNEAEISKKVKIDSIIKKYIGEMMLKLNKQESNNFIYRTFSSKKYSGFRFVNLENYSIQEEDGEMTAKVKLVVYADVIPPENKEGYSEYRFTGIPNYCGSTLGTAWSYPYYLHTPEKKFVGVDLKIDLISEIAEIVHIDLNEYTYVF